MPFVTKTKMNGRGRPVCLPDRWRRQPSSARAIGASREGPPRGHLRPYAAQSATDCRAPISHGKSLILAENCRKSAENGGFHRANAGSQDVRDWVVGSVAAGWSCCATAALLCPPPLGPGSTPSTECAPLVHGRDHLDLDHRLGLSEAADVDHLSWTGDRDDVRIGRLALLHADIHARGLDPVDLYGHGYLNLPSQMLTGAEDAARFAAIAIGERGLG